MDRETFLARGAKKQSREVHLEDGQIVHVRKLSQAEVETLKRQYASESKALEGLRYVVSRCVVDDAGKRVFGDEDMAALAAVDFEVIQTISTEAMKFSGLKVPNS